MKKIVIIGASGLGKEIKTLIDDVNDVSPTWEIVGFYDDAFTKVVEVFQGVFCLGTVDMLVDAINSEISVVFAIANREAVYKNFEKLKTKECFGFPNLFHPSIKLDRTLCCGKGNVIAFGTFLSCDITFGDFNFLNIFVGVGHDVEIGSFNCLMPRTQISGKVIIGNFNFFGMNSAIVQNKVMGNNNVINAYTLLTKSIKNDRKYFGIPGRKIDN